MEITWHLKHVDQEDSPPAWTQEAYRPQEAQDADPPLLTDPPRLDLTPPADWTWHPPLSADWPGPPLPPVGWLTWLPPGWTWPPAPRRLDLTPPGWTWPPPLADWPDPPAGPDPPLLAGPDPPPAGPDPPPPTGWTWPPPPKCGQTENITFPILRMRAVNIQIEVGVATLNRFKITRHFLVYQYFIWFSK